MSRSRIAVVAAIGLCSAIALGLLIAGIVLPAPPVAQQGSNSVAVSLDKPANASDAPATPVTPAPPALTDSSTPVTAPVSPAPPRVVSDHPVRLHPAHRETPSDSVTVTTINSF